MDTNAGETYLLNIQQNNENELTLETLPHHNIIMKYWYYHIMVTNFKMPTLPSHL